MAPPKAFPNVPVKMSILSYTPNCSATPCPVGPTTPAECDSSTITSALYFSASSQILSIGATFPSIENTPSVAMIR